MIGTTVGPYQVVAKLGAGGMGEVYRGRDAKLQRDVAIKVLPAAFARDPERLARFEREARTLAALNHPNIAQIYGLEGGEALVMEFVEGEDLAERIARSPIPIDDATAVAKQIAAALDAAHSAGIVHRDLKPANVRVRPDGQVKVLDFGLAKAFEATAAAAASSGSLADSPTLTSPHATALGVILGTAAYMSPEQARGRLVDKRTDIWAFGCVLYEMLTGRPAFSGDTVTDILGSIVKTEPDWSALPAETPSSVVHLLRRLLEKDATKRLRDIGDATVDLNAAVEPVRAAPPSRRTGARLGLPAVAGLMAVVAAGAGLVGYVMRRPAPPAAPAFVQKFHVAIQAEGGTIRAPAISPNGRSVAFIRGPRIVVQDLGSWDSRELPGTETPSRLFWSHDSQWIGFVRSEAILKVPATGGPVVRVATVPAVQTTYGAATGVWREDGTIILSQVVGPLLAIPGNGGEPKPFLTPPPAIARTVRDLSLLPDGAMLAVLRGDGVSGIGLIADGTVRMLLEVSEVRAPHYTAPGYVIFERGNPTPSLWAVRFAADRRELTGEPFLIGAGTDATVSRDGTIAFLQEAIDLAREVAWFTMDGKVGPRVVDAREWNEGLDLSRDGRRLLAASRDGIWQYDIASGTRSRITTRADDITPKWLDQNRIVFVRSDPDGPVMVLRSLAPGGDERVLARQARFPQLAADAKRLVFNIRTESGKAWEVAWVDLDTPATIHRLGDVHRGARFPSVSPDGTVIAYVSGEVGGQDEVFVTTLPTGEGKWQVSNGGGGWTFYSPRGDGVFYRALDGNLMFVPVTGARGQISIAPPRRLFTWGANWSPHYALAADGARGLAAMPPGGSGVRSLSIIRNWQLEFPGK